MRCPSKSNLLCIQPLFQRRSFIHSNHCRTLNIRLRMSLSRLQGCCVSICGLFPAFSVTGLLLWSFYAVLFKIFSRVPAFHNGMGITVCLLTTMSWVLTLVSYYRVLLAGPGSPMDIPELCVPDYDDDDAMSGRRRFVPPVEFVRSSVMIKSDGGYRFCGKCKCWKPDRCHHCSGCNRCILRMDHHCPWFGTCLGFRNYRYFIQFLVHADVYLILVTGCSIWTLWGFIVDEKWPLEWFSMHVIFTSCLGSVFLVAMLIFTIMTLYQLCRNRTTIESYELQRIRNRHSTTRDPFNVFDLGWRANCRYVMGPSWKTWVFPLSYEDPTSTALQRVGAAFPVCAAYEGVAAERELAARVSGEWNRV